MTVELRQATAGDVPAMGRILYDAFKDIAESHGFPPDFPNAEIATGVSGLLVQQETVYSIAAREGGALRGSNHLELWDEVGGIGPISVDLTAQGGGIGRTMMQHAIDHARESGFDRVRLMQDAFNMRSLALYASLGFNVVEPVAYLELSTAGPVDANFRPATAADYDAMDALCREIYGISRKNEIATLASAGFPGFVIDRGRITGYLLGTAIGHGVAESDDDLLALYRSLGATSPDSLTNLPMRSGELYRRALDDGHRNRKVMNLMALGPYDDPKGTWAPSVIF
jgi:N-acetylglutamate synthase-like GNAT family acetyltransferase